MSLRERRPPAVRAAARHEDPGLQPERTMLAWARTVLSLGACSILFLRWLPTHRWGALVPALIAVVGGSLIMMSRRRTVQRTVSAIRNERADPPILPVFSVCALVILTGIAAMVII